MQSRQHDDRIKSWEEELHGRDEICFEPQAEASQWFLVFGLIATAVGTLLIVSGSPANWSWALRLTALVLVGIAAGVLKVALDDRRKPRQSLCITNLGIDLGAGPVIPWAEVLHAFRSGKRSSPLVIIEVPTSRYQQAQAPVGTLEAIAARLRFPGAPPGRGRLLALRHPVDPPDAIVEFILLARGASERPFPTTSASTLV